jgi:thiol-disulfide isomerase/thioredoxin
MRVLLGLALLASAARADIVSDVQQAMYAGDLQSADNRVAEYRRDRGNTPEGILANSWIARGMLERGQPDGADKRAMETRAWALELLAHRKLDAEPALPLALGAAIEVHAQVLALRGAHADAAAFLTAELARYRATSIAARLQKNLNLLTLEGHPAPPIDVAHWTGDLKPEPLAALRGSPVLLFFWAHWCVDCKADIPVMQMLREKYGPRGLKIVGPTMLYGYAQGGDDAPPLKELAWIEATRQRYYARIGPMPAPLSAAAFQRYGVSTTPTIVLVDKQGIVRLYHPGAATYNELAPAVEKLLKG